MPITTIRQTNLTRMTELAATHECSCGRRLTVAWGQIDEGYGYILRCGRDPKHNSTVLIDTSAGEEEIRRRLGRRNTYVATKVSDEKARALIQYDGITALTQKQAWEIVTAIFPGAPDIEVKKAAILCTQYQLNPLMKHVFLIPFNKGTDKESWALVIGIKAKRLLASRRGRYGYVDGTPRVMTEDEQKATFGEAFTDRICVVTKVRDDMGNEAPGYGIWMKSDKVYGTDKGNSAFNMAAIRSESAALDRLMPGMMPKGVEVVDEDFVPSTQPAKVVEASIAEKNKLPRDPESLRSKPFGKLCEACWEDFKMYPSDILRECNTNDSSNITDLPEAYRQIAAVRQA